jgi:hypothetical protein
MANRNMLMENGVVTAAEVQEAKEKMK